MDGCQTGTRISKRLLSTSIDPDGKSVHLLKPGLSRLAFEASISSSDGSRPHRAETTEKTKARVSGPCLVMLANIASGLRWRLYECVGPSSGRDASRYGPPP